MRLVESRTTLTITYIVLAARAVHRRCFPIALLVLNSLKTAAGDRPEPAGAAAGDPLGQFQPRLGRRALQPGPS